MCDKRASAKATQNQVVLCVVPFIMYRHVLYNIAVCAQDVVGPGALLPSPPEHAPRPTVLQPQLSLREEMSTHVLKTPSYLFLLKYTVWHL